MARKKKTLNDVVDSLVDSAFEILDFRAKLAMGRFDELPENYIQFDETEQKRILEMVKPLLSSAQQTRKVKAETSKDIIKMVKTGKVSISEAMNLMVLTKTNLEVEEKEMKVKLQKKMIGMLSETEE